MDKVRVNILLDREIRQKCKEYGINISAFTEIKLQEYIALKEGRGESPKSAHNLNECGCRDLNPSYKLGKLK